ncbi:MAG: V-type ATP synthase subunit I [Thermoplasmata archaeon]
MGILRPEPMRKVGILGLHDDREAILTALHDLRIAQIEPVSAGTLRFLDPGRPSELQRRVADEALRFRGLKGALPAQPVPHPQPFATLEEVLAAARAVPIDEEVGALVREDDRLQSRAKSLEESLRLVDSLAFLSGRLEALTTQGYLPFLAEASRAPVAELWPAGSGAVLLPSPDPGTAVVLVPRSTPDLVARVSSAGGIRLTAIPPFTGTPGEVRAALSAERAELSRRREEIAGRRAAIAREWYPRVAAIDEALQIQARLFEVYGKLGAGPNTFAVEGWVPARDLDRLRAAVDRAGRGRAFVYAVPTEEAAPTLMANPPGVRRFEFFVRFYSLPQASEWDPTVVFAIVFPIFFGLMLGDWGYGLVILGICLWMIRGFPGGGRIPRPIRTFVTRIMGPEGMRQLAYALVPGCLVAIGLGLYFDEFFGFHLLRTLVGYHAAVDPKTSVGLLLLVAGSIGVAMVCLGFAMGALKEYFHHHRRGAVGKLGGIVFTVGIALFGLYVIRQHGFSGPLLLPYLGVTLAGVALLFAGEGPFAMMGLIETISHILSYTRLVGILLASVILAEVINLIGTHLPHHFPAPLAALGILVGALILVVGQGFNVVLGVFEPGIQGARLLFVEYFSKFYEGNGRPFRPFGAPRRFTRPTMAEAAPGPIFRGQNPPS